MIQKMICRMMAERDIDLVVPLYIEHYRTDSCSGKRALTKIPLIK